MASCASPRGTGQRRRIEIDENTSAVVFTRPDAREIDVVDDDVRWTFSVDANNHAELVEIYPAERDDLPDWVTLVLEEVGIEGVEE